MLEDAKRQLDTLLLIKKKAADFSNVTGGASSTAPVVSKPRGPSSPIGIPPWAWDSILRGFYNIAPPSAQDHA